MRAGRGPPAPNSGPGRTAGAPPDLLYPRGRSYARPAGPSSAEQRPWADRRSAPGFALSSRKELCTPKWAHRCPFVAPNGPLLRPRICSILAEGVVRAGRGPPAPNSGPGRTAGAPPDLLYPRGGSYARPAGPSSAEQWPWADRRSAPGFALSSRKELCTPKWVHRCPFVVPNGPLLRPRICSILAEGVMRAGRGPPAPNSGPGRTAGAPPDLLYPRGRSYARPAGPSSAEQWPWADRRSAPGFALSSRKELCTPKWVHRCPFVVPNGPLLRPRICSILAEGV
eukprot:gene58225-biopygen63883